MPAPPLPPIRGFEPLSLAAWEGRVAAVVRLQGCNFACPACPVPHLIPRATNPSHGPERGTIPVESVLQSVHQRRRWLDAVVIGGGEPTLHEGLPALAELFHEFGLRVRVQTNGTDPDMLKRLLDSGAVTSLSMTVRAPLDPTYAKAVGASPVGGTSLGGTPSGGTSLGGTSFGGTSPGPASGAGRSAGVTVRLASLFESVERILRDPGDHEFRVPWITGLVEAPQVESILRMLAGARRVVLEPAPDGAPGVRALRRAARAAGRAVESCVLAGRPGEEFGSLALHAAGRQEGAS